MRHLLLGRQVTREELGIRDEAELDFVCQSYPAVEKMAGSYLCKRCGNNKEFYQNPYSFEEDTYCLACLTMGKMSTRNLLYHLPEENNFLVSNQDSLTWQGQLSPEQNRAGQAIIQSIKNYERRLIWAVTGAGKTEMLFPGLAYAFNQGHRVVLASPRVDVCIELFPRLKAAFNNTSMVLLHGKQEEPYSYAQLTVATTHQLLRFYQAFDLLVIDEVDAFPFEGDPVLERAVDQARKPKSTLIYLTATPNDKMQIEIKTGELQATILPARYHGHPLPEPKFSYIGDWESLVYKRPKQAIAFIGKILANQRRFLLFLADIKLMLALDKLLRNSNISVSFESVHASDSKRLDKVQAMRNGKLTFLMTTTILERGVTFTDIDVYVLGSENPIFNEPALVQIAGRAGRNRDFPKGEVTFFHNGKSWAMIRARKQIQSMNISARKQGLIK